jgi:hypothetical protein
LKSQSAFQQIALSVNLGVAHENGLRLGVVAELEAPNCQPNSKVY